MISSRRLRVWAILAGLGIALWLASTGHAEGNVADEVRHDLDGLRGFTVPKDPKMIAAMNQRMDATWKFAKAHANEALPIIAEELQRALAAPAKDSFFIMDTAFLLCSEHRKGAEELGVAALQAIDPNADIIRANWQELFELAMKVGASGVEARRYLAAVDRLYFSNEKGIEMFRVPHYVLLNGEELRLMVFGVAGDAAAVYLAEQLADRPGDRPKLLELLGAVGGEEQVPAVNAVLTKAKDFETVTRCVGMLMRVGGPAGRAAVLAVDPKSMDRASRDYMEKIRRSVEGVSVKQIAKELEEVAEGQPNDATLQHLLDEMERNDGVDDKTPPAAVLRSGLPTDALLAQMKRIRARSFRRMASHVFEDLPITNLLINGLQFRRAAEQAGK